MRSVPTVCSDVKVLAQNISNGYRHRANSGTDGDEEVLLRRNITYRSQLRLYATGRLNFKWLNQYRKEKLVDQDETLRHRWLR